MPMRRRSANLPLPAGEGRGEGPAPSTRREYSSCGGCLEPLTLPLPSGERDLERRSGEERMARRTRIRSRFWGGQHDSSSASDRPRLWPCRSRPFFPAAARAQEASPPPLVAQIPESPRPSSSRASGSRRSARTSGSPASRPRSSTTRKSSGAADSDTPTSPASRPATADTLYSICSISKLFTSVARDAAARRRDAPPRGPGREAPAVVPTEADGGRRRDHVEGLLTHASGLPRESGLSRTGRRPTSSSRRTTQIVEKLASQEALYRAGGALPVLEPRNHARRRDRRGDLRDCRTTRTSAAASSVPLGLQSTTPEMPESERGKRLATGYTALDREGRRAPLPFFTAKGIGPRRASPPTSEDLARFASWQFRLLEKGGTEVLKATTLREMHRVHWVEPDFETLWGLGFAVWRKTTRRSSSGTAGAVRATARASSSCPPRRSRRSSWRTPRAWTRASGPAPLRHRRSRGRGRGQGAGQGQGAGPRRCERYAGTYDAQPWAGEIAVLAWEDGLAMLELPTMDPVKSMDKLRRIPESTGSAGSARTTLSARRSSSRWVPTAARRGSPSTATTCAGCGRRDSVRARTSISHTPACRSREPSSTTILGTYTRPWPSSPGSRASLGMTAPNR